MTERLSSRFLGVAVVSLAVLVLELTLTRLFSATMFYHFAFLAISVALFGSGASGVFLYVLRPRLTEDTAATWLAGASALFSASTVVGLVLILGHPISPITPGLSTLGALAWIYGGAALPFFFAGAVITLAITTWAERISLLYLFDLAGAALGCLALVPLLGWLGAVDTVLAVSVLAAAGGYLLSRKRWLLAVMGLAIALVAANRSTGAIRVRESKGLTEQGVVFSRWNSFSRVTVTRTEDPGRMLIFIDADAATWLLKDGPDLARHAEHRSRIETLAYQVGGRDKVLIIGPGGGVDVVIARLFGASDVTAVELNPLVARDVMSAEPFLSFSGRLYEQPGVHLVVDEGRSFLRRSREHYDLVLATMVDTWAATAAGAFALSENNLYTVEAFSDYLERLGPDGILSMTRWHQSPPDQLLRLLSLGRTALARRGIGDARQHFIVVKGRQEGQPLATATVLLKKSPFRAEEVERAEAFARDQGFEVLYTPRTTPPNDLTRLVTAEDAAAFWRGFPSNIAPPTDDSPFFFQSARPSAVFSGRWARGEWRRTNLGTLVLFALVAISLVVVVFFILGPLLFVRRRLNDAATKGRLWFLLDFAALGAGFIVAEVVLVQKAVLFLGHPSYALTVVLFAVMLWSGIGSFLSGRFPTASLPRRLPFLLAGAALVIGLSIVALPPLFYGLVHLPTLWRVLITVGALAPLGLTLGMPMPTGIRMLAARAPALIPWAWGVNGAASVLGSVGAVALAMIAGFDRTLLVAAALYLAALGFVSIAVARTNAPA